MSWAPFELGLQNKLEVEKRRFASDWLFRWHNLHTQARAVEVENFAGGRISYSGVPLNSQMQSVFWQAVTRYLLNFVHQTFDRWAKEAASYDVAARRHSLAHTEAVLRGFADATISKAVDTDHRVRGAGPIAPLESSNVWSKKLRASQLRTGCFLRHSQHPNQLR